MTARRPTILLVDDLPENLLALRLILEVFDADIIECSSGNDALVATLDHDFAVAILDAQMPEMNGYELAEILRADARTQHLPLIFLTANYGDEQHVFQGYEAGAVDYLTKPCPPAILRSKIKVFLELAAQRRQLQEHQLQLENLVAELVVAREQADAANKAKSAFLANMSHEIRTPLNAVLGYSQILQQSGLGADQKRSVDAIMRAGKHLLELINNVLDLSKIEAGKTTLLLKPTEIHDLFVDAETIFSQKMASKGLILRFATAPGLPKCILSDGPKISQILLNLLSNAWKFTQRGSITVSLDGHAENPPNFWAFTLSVSDSGCGIPADEIGKIFAAFEQSSSGIKAGGGTGLGLAISKNLAQLLGGDLRVDSQLGSGSTFSLDFRAEIGATDTNSAPRPAFGPLDPDQGEIRLLIVDDGDDNRAGARGLLEPLGFALEEARNGQEALERCATWKPHIVLMDLVMPVLDGVAATQALRQRTEGKDTCIIAVSASSRHGDLTAMTSVGFNTFVSKPYLLQDLLGAIAQHSSCRFTLVSTLADAKPSMVDASHLAALPAPLLSQLRQAALIGDLARLDKLVPEIQTHAPALATLITEALASFDFTTLQTLLQNPDAGQP